MNTGCRKGRIVIVDDDEAIRESLKLLLEANGYEVEAFASGDDLLGSASCANCDCLVLDVHLPDGTGPEILRKLRASGAKAPAIFMSGLGSATLRAKLQREFTADFFEKPVSAGDLLAGIARATARK